MKKNRNSFSLLMFSAAVITMGTFTSCEKKDYAIPEPKTNFQNDVIKRSLGPAVAGTSIEFAYAMALGKMNGKIVSAQVEASVTGAPATYLEHRSFNTNASGQDIGVIVGTPSTNNGNTTLVNFTVDTNAATLRYYYVVPSAGKGQQVSFTFSATSSTGEKVSFPMGPYALSKMDMVLDLPVKENAACYISIADNAIYTAAEAALHPEKIDLVYLFRNLPTVAFGHALVAPATEPIYLQGAVLPAGVNRNALISKAGQLRDQQLARLQFGIFIDDADFEKLNIAGSPNYAINMKAQTGVWVETADKKYRAYVYFNSINDAAQSAVISIKRYPLQ
ncbi:DUF4466 family protein [Terrimonas sp. NA20]|uniref:DUF4466 family protein n=1 Tax=Terrimonas ginsenosidimutans TaxID=2908004 RepID=A0ABS9KT15_9BACT|nr:DUF4466 family protein [Terrimonas ginsenosidimutans]MCG2615477.1 DUF4466 family protein [Terrimonas ginsenosidimutans]